MLEQYLDLGHDRFLPNLYQFIYQVLSVFINFILYWLHFQPFPNTSIPSVFQHSAVFNCSS
jgi:hypothetical protein